MMQWSGKVALVTGAASGIGRATAIAFARAGARVVASDHQAQDGEETARSVREAGGEALFVGADVSSPPEVAELIEQTIRHYGRLDCAFNNAGIEGAMARTAECSEENWERTLAVNLKGVWLCMKHQIPHLLERGGAIVNCASIAGLVGFKNLPAYVASKHGVVGLTRTAALEYARDGIRVNAVCPGVIRTAMVERIIRQNPAMESQLTAAEPIGRMGRPEEIASAVLWLCSEDASFVTGQALAIDGGWVAQ